MSHTLNGRARRHAQANAKEALDALTDEERARVFSLYCKACGSKDPACTCTRHE